MSFSLYASTRCQRIESTLNELIEERKNFPHSSLFEAARYSLLSRAKRLRPLLTLAAVETFGGNIEAALHPACALELIHTYSLIHDDLPCMDDDDLRRGRATLHKIYGEGHAVLTGDYLLTYAFEVIAKAPLIPSDQKIELIKVLAEGAGGDGMVGGQTVDLLCEGKETDWKTLQFIHHNKTAALISCALDFGAIIANVSFEDRTNLQRIGHEIGLSFQIIDDILDVTGSESEIGKPTHSDSDNQKSTSITVLGLEKAQALADALLESVQNRCKKLSADSSILEEILQSLIHRKS